MTALVAFWPVRMMSVYVARLRVAQLKVFDSIVRPVAVDVVHNLGTRNHSAKVFSHHKSVLKNVTTPIRHRVTPTDLLSQIATHMPGYTTLPTVALFLDAMRQNSTVAFQGASRKFRRSKLTRLSPDKLAAAFTRNESSCSYAHNRHFTWLP